MKHILGIKKQLGISGIYTQGSSFYHPGNDTAEGFQIDMLIERQDHAIQICEIKFYNTEFVFTKESSTALRQKNSQV